MFADSGVASLDALWPEANLQLLISGGVPSTKIVQDAQLTSSAADVAAAAARAPLEGPTPLPWGAAAWPDSVTALATAPGCGL